MAIHAEISEEARKRLAQQRRNSTISSLLISVLAIVLIGFVLAFIALKVYTPDVEVPIAYTSNVVEQVDITKKKITETVVRKPAAPSAVQNRVITASTTSALSVPTPDVDFSEPQVDFGDGEDFGLGAGDDPEAVGDGGVTGVIPTILRKRCSLQDRLERLKASGGNEECEAAVVRALNYLKNTQAPSGAWEMGPYSVGNTAMALLTFLGHCETGASKDFGGTVTDAITYLINVGMKQDGRLASSLSDKHWPYEHSIAVYALAEALSLSRGFNLNIENIEEVLTKAGQVLIDGQHERTGGWDYAYDREGNRGGDTSIAGWHIQALKAMGHTGLSYDGLASSERDALDFFEDHQAPNGGVSYSTPNPNDDQLNGNGTTLGVVAALCYQIMGKSNSSVARKALDHAIDGMEFDYNNSQYDLYGHYYAAQAFMNQGGKNWKKFNEGTRDNLLAAQNEDGSWKQPWGSGGMAKGGNALNASYGFGPYAAHYRTCLAALTLEVYYRFLPATGGR